MGVEIDEGLFTRRKNHQGRVLPQQWVFGGYCRQTKECFMYPVEVRSAATLLPIIEDSVHPGSNVHSDLWRAYNVTHRSMLDSYFCEYMWRQCYKNEDLFADICSSI